MHLYQQCFFLFAAKEGKTNMKYFYAVEADFRKVGMYIGASISVRFLRTS